MNEFRPAFDPKRDLKQPESRAEATPKDYFQLIHTGQDVQNIGKGRLVITYANEGENAGKRIQITCKSGKAAKRTQMLMRRDLRHSNSNAHYNSIIDAFFAAIAQAREAQADGVQQ